MEEIKTGKDVFLDVMYIIVQGFVIIAITTILLVFFIQKKQNDEIRAKLKEYSNIKVERAYVDKKEVQNVQITSETVKNYDIIYNKNKKELYLEKKK